MPSSAKPAPSLVLVCGDDEFAVKQRAKEIYHKWCDELGGMDHEIIDASASNSSEALKALGRVRESLQTLPFFGSGKAVWLQDCNFLGDERAASTKAVTELLAEFAQELKKFFVGKRPPAHQRREGGQAEGLLQVNRQARLGGKFRWLVH